MTGNPQEQTAPLAASPAGRVLGGRYQVEDTLAAGGMGFVLRGHDTLLSRTVAIKGLHPHLAGTSYADRFLNEAQTLAALNHPNLVTIYDVLRSGDLPYLVMEYVEGESLSSIIQREGAMRPDPGVPLAVQICRGLTYAHERGVVHRDIKPQNLILTSSGLLKIIDFGIARGPSSAELTEPGLVLGTAYYLAPEVAAGQPASPRSDLYSLGVVLYRLFTGQLPFPGDDPVAVAMSHRTHHPLPPSAVRPGISRALESVLLRLLEKDPDRRYPSAAAVASDLSRLLPANPPSDPRSAVDPEATEALAGPPAGTHTEVLPRRPSPRALPFLPWLEPRHYLVALLALALAVVSVFALWLTTPGLAADPAGSRTSAAEALPASRERAAALVEDVNERAGNIRGNKGDKLKRLVGDLAKAVNEAKPSEYAKQLTEVEKEVAALAKDGHLLSGPAARISAALKELTEAVQRESGG